MERIDFLKKLGLGGGALLAVYCTGSLGSCGKKSSTIPQPENKDFTLDLTNSAYAALKNNGGYVIANTVVVAKTKAGIYVAVTQICSHQGNTNVVYQQSTDDFYCGVHGALYDTLGNGLNSNGSNGLKKYNTALSGTSLRIYS